jgi:signal transduction histidine kinase
MQLDLQVDDLFADRISIGEVIDNLLTNSIKYTSEEGSIGIKTSRDNPDKLTLEFSDTGMGIPQKELQYIFDEFYIATNNKGAGTGNTGMGLAIVQNIVKSHKGSIHVRSNEGEGTVFTIRLPADTIQNGENQNNP